MMDSGYLLIACGFVGLAIALSFWRSTEALQRALDVRMWLTRGLYRGDFQALSVAARGHVFDLDPDQFTRLAARGFVRQNLFGGNDVTLKGRAALALRAALGKDRFASN
jgi:hypothetical protein